jgi:hypothetical protein
MAPTSKASSPIVVQELLSSWTRLVSAGAATSLPIRLSTPAIEASSNIGLD